MSSAEKEIVPVAQLGDRAVQAYGIRIHLAEPETDPLVQPAMIDFRRRL